MYLQVPVQEFLLLIVGPGIHVLFLYILEPGCKPCNVGFSDD
jgi:hypothetical protein